MIIPDLKTDKLKPHHYIFCVVSLPLICGDRAGKIQLRTNPIYFHNDDVDKLRDVIIAIQDKVFKITEKQALKNAGEKLSGLVHSISMVKMISHIEQGTVHHISSKHLVSKEDFEAIIDLANKDIKWAKDILNDSRIR